MPRNITCYICGVPLKGGSDTFGNHGYEMCRECWLKHVDEDGKRTATPVTDAEIHKTLSLIGYYDVEFDEVKP